MGWIQRKLLYMIPKCRQRKVLQFLHPVCPQYTQFEFYFWFLFLELRIGPTSFFSRIVINIKNTEINVLCRLLFNTDT